MQCLLSVSLASKQTLVFCAVFTIADCCARCDVKSLFDPRGWHMSLTIHNPRGAMHVRLLLVVAIMLRAVHNHRVRRLLSKECARASVCQHLHDDWDDDVWTDGGHHR